MTFVVVSHDIALVALLCEHLVVLEKGRIVEQGRSRTLLSNPKHPYTQRLLASTPRMPAAEAEGASG